MMEPTRVFIHGLESTSQGTKGVYFRNHYPDMIIEDYTGPIEERMHKLTTVLAGKDHLILVGSSYGGLMAAMFACRHPERVSKLILLAPALNLPEFARCREKRVEVPVILYHGDADDLVPPEEVRSIAAASFTSLIHHLVKDDHPLSRTFSVLPWRELLQG